MPRVTYDLAGAVARIGLARPEKRNAFDRAMFDELSAAYERFEGDPAARAALLFAHGDHFTGGLELSSVGPEVAAGAPLFSSERIDPLGLGPRRREKPVVMAVQGYCFTIGIELALACDVRICSNEARFSQAEVARGIPPFGGATLRFPQLGWGNAMRWMLTGELFDAAEALRIGLVQQVTERAALDATATRIAETIAAQAPLAVRTTMASSRAALVDAEAEAARLPERARALFATEDAAEGMRAFVERRPGKFRGR